MIQIRSATLKMNSPSNTIQRLGLGKAGRVQAFFTSEIRRMADPYVPMDTGTLKNTAVVSPVSITYVQPYAQKNYYGHKSSIGRGRRWVERMWAEKQKAIMNSVQAYMKR